MASKNNKVLREGYDRLKKTLEKIIKRQKEQGHPRLVLQPVPNRPAGIPTPGNVPKDF